MIGRLLAVLATLALLASCSAASGTSGVPGRPLRPSTAAPPAPTALTVSNPRSGPGVVLSGGLPAPYNYAPTVMQDHGAYRAWWCSQVPGVGPGDDILYAESSYVDGPFTADGGAAAVPVFAGQPGAFDAMHTCDPSVIKVGGTYYLYYTGAAGDHAHGNAIGVASSTDGRAWRRDNDGKPIVTPSGMVQRENAYGAGQPSVVYLDGWFYLVYTDTTAVAAGHNGAGQFVLRARDADFSDDVQWLTDTGFAPVGTGIQRSVVDGFSVDMTWVDALSAFAIAHETAEGTTITFFDRDFRQLPYRPVVIGGPWQEGPGWVRRPDGHAPVSTSDPCGTVPLDVFRATAANPAPTDIERFGVDITGVRGCGQPQSAQAVLDGFAIPSPEHTVDIVRGGEKLRVERRSLAEVLVPKVLDDWMPALSGLPVLGTIRSGARAFRAPWGEVALEDNDGRLWTVDPAAVAANSSAVVDMAQQQWDNRQHGDLRGK